MTNEIKSTSENRPLLDIKNLAVSFQTVDGEVQAVRDVSYKVYAGEVLGVVGESGSGKSVTALRVMQLLAENAIFKSGSIKFENEDITNIKGERLRNIRGKDIAMIFQDPMTSLNPLKKVGHQVEEMLKIHENLNADERKKRVLELFEQVRIPEGEKRFNSYPHEFSGGMRQRVMIAIALACNPKLLFADEPTTALDVTIQDQILKLIKELKKDVKAGIVFITHDLGVVAEVCNRVVVMYGGMVMEEADVDDLYENPSHPYTMGLLNSIPKIDQDKNQELEPIDGTPPDMLNPPLGCPFAPRCKYAKNICANELPKYYEIGSRHRSRCWLLDENAPEKNNPFKSK